MDVKLGMPPGTPSSSSAFGEAGQTDISNAQSGYRPTAEPELGAPSNDVMPGYKRTEVGVIPEDWNALQMRQLARSIFRGASPRPIDSPVWFDETSQIGWVRISDVTKTTRHLSETQQHLSKRGVARSRSVPSGSLIMSICATVGKPIETRFDVCIHDGFVVFERPNSDQSFLYHLLKDLEPHWSTKGQTGSQMNLNTGLIKDTVVPVPPTKAEQKAIATALSDADALIAALQRLIAKKCAIKQGTMQALLTGEGEIKPLGAMLKIRHGKSQRGVEDENGPYPILATGGRIGRANAFLYDKPSVLIGRKGTIDKPQFMSTPFWTVDTLFYSEIIGKNDPRFLYYQFLLINWNRYNEASGVPSLNAHTIEQIEIVVPEPEEQTAIATVLSDMDAEIEALEARLAKTRALKAGMMQQLLTGRIRLV